MPKKAGTKVNELVEELVKYLPEHVAQRFKESCV